MKREYMITVCPELVREWDREKYRFIYRKNYKRIWENGMVGLSKRSFIQNEDNE